jgi:hypothetical protein
MSLNTNVELLLFLADNHYIISKCSTSIEGVLHFAALSVAIAVVFLKLDHDNTNETSQEIKMKEVVDLRNTTPIIQGLPTKLYDAIENETLNLTDNHDFDRPETVAFCILSNIKYGSSNIDKKIEIIQAAIKIKKNASDAIKMLKYIEISKVIIFFALIFACIGLVILSFFAINHKCFTEAYITNIILSLYSILFLFVSAVAFLSKNKIGDAIETNNKIIIERAILNKMIADKVNTESKDIVINTHLEK